MFNQIILARDPTKIFYFFIVFKSGNLYKSKIIGKLGWISMHISRNIVFSIRNWFFLEMWLNSMVGDQDSVNKMWITLLETQLIFRPSQNISRMSTSTSETTWLGLGSSSDCELVGPRSSSTHWGQKLSPR